MGQEKKAEILQNNNNFRPDARVWRMNLAYRVINPHTYFGRFSSPEGQSEVNHPNVLADTLPAVWAEHLPIQYQALTGRGDTCLTVEDPIDSTVLKPIDQMNITELKQRGLVGISVDTGTTFKKIHPDGTTTQERIRRFYPTTALIDFRFKQSSFTLSYKDTQGDDHTATYDRGISSPTAITKSAVLPDMYQPPKETI